MRRSSLLFVLFMAGAFSQAAQALMGLGFFYASWLFWIAAGSLAMSRARHGSAGASFALAAGLMPAAAAAGLLAFDLCRRFIDVAPAQPVPLELSALWSLLATGPMGFAVGAAFPLACAALGGEEDPAGVYSWDALGGLLGGALLTAALAGGVPSWRLAGGLAGALGLSIVLLPGEEAGRAARALAAAWMALGLSAFSPFGAAWQAKVDRLRWEASMPGLELIESFDTPYQTVGIARLGALTSVVADGKVAASFPDSSAPAMEAALVLAQHPAAKRALVLEGAARGLAGELLKHRLDSVDSVESDEAAFRRIRPHLPPSYREALEDPRLRLRFADPRLFLNRAPPGAYDLIVAFTPDPATAQLNRLFTKEFYQRCRHALSEDGVFVTRLTSSANYMGRELRVYDASVARTLREVFADVRAAPGDPTVFFASDGRGLTLDPAVLARRYEGVRPKGGIPSEALRSLWSTERAKWFESSLEKGGGELNTDLRPVTYYFSMLLWARISDSRWAGVFESVRLAGARLFLFPVLLLIVLRLAASVFEEPAKEERAAAGLAMAALGFSAMALELVLLLAFQSSFGSLYGKLGLLNGLFMAGLAAGAWSAGALGASRSARPWLPLSASAGAAALLAVLLPRLLGGGAAGEPAYWGLSLLTGALIGSGFPSAVRMIGRRQGERASASGIANSLDHLGGMGGALLTGGCLVPLLGVETACRLVCAIAALACLPVLLSGLKGYPGVRELFRRAGGHPWLRLSERMAPSFPLQAPGRWAAALALAALLLSTAAKEAEPPPPGLGFSDGALAEVSGLERFEYRPAPFPHYRNFDRRGEKAGASLGTLAVAADVKGFGGPISLLLSLSESGRILGVRLLDSKETPSYTRGLPGWLKGFRGLDASRPLRLGKDIDGLSGATVTSGAVVETVNRAAAAANEKILGGGRSGGPEAGGASAWGSPRTAAVGVLLALFFPVFFSGRRWARLLYLAAAVGVLGFWANTLIALPDLAALARGELPGAGRAAWLLVAAFALLTSLLWGQVYCGFVCPFGAAQELVWAAVRALGLRLSPSRPLDGAARYGKFLLLPAVLCVYWLTGREGWLAFEPLQRAFRLEHAAGLSLLLAAVLAAGAFFFRFWCRYFCPTGAFLALFNKLAVGRPLAPKREFRFCDLGVRGEFDVDCIQCQRCVHHAREGP